MNDYDEWLLDGSLFGVTDDNITEERREMNYDVQGEYLPRELWDAPGTSRGVDAEARTRNVLELRVNELLSAAGKKAHRRRAPVVIDGVEVQETLRQRIAREKAELETALTQIANQLARRTSQLEHLTRFPEEDPFQDGTTLQFEKSFPATPDTRYSYVAHRVNDRWYVSGGRSPQNITWDELVDWMGLGVETVYQLAPSTRVARRKVIG